jgi:hypothetical protein
VWQAIGEHAGVLTVTGVNGIDRRLLNEIGTIEVWKALAEVNRIVLCCKTADLRENSFAEGREAAGNRKRGCGALYAS